MYSEYDFQKTIIKIRKELVISQQELAEMLHLSFATINRWERGHFEPNYKGKRKIINFCQKNKIELVEREGK